MCKNSDNLSFSTGLDALDTLLGGVIPGDNFVWHVDRMETFRPVAAMFIRGARKHRHGVVHFRWGTKRPEETSWVDPVCECILKPEDGFEAFITQIHTAIEEAAPGTVFLFDLLSELTDVFRSEQSLENFFVLTCPFILSQKHLGIFPILRGRHPFSTAHPIQETTQIAVDLFQYKGLPHLHLRKVDGRYTEFMYTIHRWEGDALRPVLNSADTVDALNESPWTGLQSASYRMILEWDRKFMAAEDILARLNAGTCDEAEAQRAVTRLLPMIITCDERMLSLFETYFSLADLVYVWKRTIGSGMIGGKAAGMLLSRAIIKSHAPEAANDFEPHDSFFIATDVYYDFLIKNNCWRIRKKQKHAETLFEDVQVGRERILNGAFPLEIMNRFSDMLDYFGQVPIIVRSSSLLEDAYGNAFAGKYDSVFCSNQGPRTERMKAFLLAVKTVYAGTMAREVLTYREKRGLLDQDEQMAILVQRVSGTRDGSRFFPHMAGVGLSFNPYLWHPDIDPEAGVLRLVVGLGTRAVDRHDDDHTRIVALNLPHQPPSGGLEDIRSCAQRRIDLIDLRDNTIRSEYFIDVIRTCFGFPLARLASPDLETEQRQRESGREGPTPYLVNFDAVFTRTDFIPRMRMVLKILREVYSAEVEIEFTATLLPEDDLRINIVQCRPFQIDIDNRLGNRTNQPLIYSDTDKERDIMAAHGAILGRSRLHAVDRIIFVAPAAYSNLREADRYKVARLIGRLTHLPVPDDEFHTVLMGPGRWGTRMPSLGVPVSSADIGRVSVMCELDIMHEGLIPDLSLGTHFFHELVEMNILYIGYFSARPENTLDMAFLMKSPNRLAALIPEAESLSDVVRVIDAAPDMQLLLSASLRAQQATISILKAKA